MRVWLRGWVVAVIAATLTVLGTGVSSGVASAALQAGTRSSAARAAATLLTSSADPAGEGQGGIQTLSCSAPGDCVAVDQDGSALIESDGTWTAPASVDPDPEFRFVSCPASAGLCVLLDDWGRAYIEKAGSWSGPTTVFQGSGGPISCASATFCMATRQVSNQWSVFDGSTWSTPEPLPSSLSFNMTLNSLSCPTATFCALVVSGEVTFFNGTTWTTPSSPPEENSWYPVVSASCPTATFCIAVDDAADAWIWNGSTWSDPVWVLGAGADLAQVSCATASWCVAATDDGGAVTYDGSTWGDAVPVLTPTDTQLLAIFVSCPVVGSCEMTDGETFGATPDDRGRAASLAGGAWSPPAIIDQNDSLGNVTCVPGRQRCLVAGEAGEVVAFNGSRFMYKTIDPDSSVTGVSCPTTSWCMAVDARGNYMTEGSGSWDGPVAMGQVVEPSEVSCISSSFCMAAVPAGSEVWNGTSWTSSPTSDSDTLVALSCATATFCVGVDGKGYAQTWSGSWGKRVAIDTWRPKAARQFWVSCTSATFCMAADDSFSEHYMVYNGTSWTAAAAMVKPAIAIEGLSCATSKFCVASLDGGYLTWRGKRWARSIAPSGNLGSVACPSARFCLASAMDGQVWY